MERNSIVFYRSFYEAMRELEPATKSQVFDAIMAFSFDAAEIPLTGIAKTVFILIRPQLEANMRRYENGMKPKRKKAEDEQPVSKRVSNDNDNVNVNVNKKERFTPPTLAEVQTFFTDNGYSAASGKNAYDYYSEASWRDSRGSAVKNWKQKMRGVWFKDENKIPSASKSVYTTPTKYRPA